MAPTDQCWSVGAAQFVLWDGTRERPCEYLTSFHESTHGFLGPRYVRVAGGNGNYLLSVSSSSDSAAEAVVVKNKEAVIRLSSAGCLGYLIV